MTLFSAFVTSLAILSRNTPMEQKNVLKNSVEESPKEYKSMPILVTCGPYDPCPENSQCMIIYGKEGFCVVVREEEE